MKHNVDNIIRLLSSNNWIALSGLIYQDPSYRELLDYCEDVRYLVDTLGLVGDGMWNNASTIREIKMVRFRDKVPYGDIVFADFYKTAILLTTAQCKQYTVFLPERKIK